MATAKEIIVDALEDILVQQEEAPIEADEARAAIRYLNDMMAMFSAKGINLGYTVVSNLSDTITVPDGAIAGIKANLSIALDPKFGGKNVSQSLIQRARAGYRAIQAISIRPGSMDFPSTLPRGAGNAQPGFLSDPFYSNANEQVLSEGNGTISLEDDTE